MQKTQLGGNVNNFLNSETFRQVEAKIIKDAVSATNKSVRRELELFKFEVIYPQIVPQKEQREIEREIIKMRDKKWTEALKKANGDEEKALMLV